MGEYQRVYGKGYNAGMKRGYRLMDTLMAIGKTLRKRAQRAEQGLSLGPCNNCRFWTREPSCFWGTCKLPEIAELELGWRGDPGQTIITSENFGCVRFEPQQQSDASPSPTEE